MVRTLQGGDGAPDDDGGDVPLVLDIAGQVGG